MKYIAVTQRVQVISDIQERRDALSQEWSYLAEVCGFLPIFLPNRIAVVKELLDTLPISGVILTGGNDLSNYGGDVPERDEVEHFLVSYASEHKFPILGICRGMQLILDHFGTELVPVTNHVRVHHKLNTGDTVNSFHNFGATQCQKPLVCTAMSEDGVIESVIHETYNWIKGIMWHPERYAPLRKQDIDMIKELFAL